MTRRRRYVGLRISVAPGLSQAELIENALSAVDLPILVVDRQLAVQIWNEAFAATRGGGSRLDLTTGAPLATVLPELRQTIRGRDWLATLRMAMEQGVSYDEERVPLTLGNETARPCNVSIRPLQRQNGFVPGAVLVLADVSEQVKLERRLRRMERTTSLADLGASVAHEIRNPLNSIGLNLQRLGERVERHPELEEDGTADILNMLGDEVKRLERIVRDFLKFSRPPRRKQASVDLRELVLRCLSFLGEEARALGVDLRQNIPRVPELPADPDLITQVFQNLLLNAIHAAVETRDLRPPRVEVEGFETKDAVAISIRDSGPGLPPEQEREKIFDLFYSTKEEGTGLGLALANRFVEDHGGSLTAENHLVASEEIGGAVFTVYLPKLAPEEEEVSPEDVRWK